MNKVKTLAVATLAVLGMATAAQAIDLGYGIALDNTVAGEYNIDTEAFTLDYTANLNYTVVDGVVVWAEMSVDIQDPAYDGVSFGADWSMDNISAYVKSNYSADNEFGDVLVGASLSF